MSEPIQIISSVPELRQVVRGWRQAGLTIGLVPTMGALHQGHLALTRLAAERGDRVVASIFVNPTQFGPDEDFERYPRQPEEDAAMLGANGCDLLFLPEVDTIYPPGHSVFVELNDTVDAPSIGMEGEFRPGHFRGVATVVAQLFNLVEPHLAVFGEKDAQQLAVIRQVVRDLHFDIEIVGQPTVREPDGLAMSSRNAYLSPEQRLAATRIHRTLEQARTRIEQGERNANTIRREIHESLGHEPLFEVNYAELVDATTFRPVERIAGEIVLPVAVDIGGTRLLDNVRIRTADVRQQTADSRQQTSDSRRQTADVRHQTSDTRAAATDMKKLTTDV